jgi:flagellar biosynthetic protein FliO
MASASTLMLFVRLIMSLGVVIGLMWIAANVLRKRGIAGTTSAKRSARGPEVELVARKPLGRNASIVVVRVGDRSMLVGVTDQRVTNLGDVDFADVELYEDNTWTVSSGATSPASAWKTMLEQMRNRTVRS